MTWVERKKGSPRLSIVTNIYFAQRIAHSARMKSWEGFLPPRALVMARRSPAALRVATRLGEAAELNTAEMHTTADPLERTTSTHPQAGLNAAPIATSAEQTDLVFVGGGTRDSQAGQLLDKMIAAMGLVPNEICVLEVDSSVVRELTDLNPRMIVALGQDVLAALLGAGESLSQHRGKISEWGSARLLATFDPADLLAQPALKRDAWADLKKVAEALDIQIPGRG